MEQQKKREATMTALDPKEPESRYLCCEDVQAERMELETKNEEIDKQLLEAVMDAHALGQSQEPYRRIESSENV